MAKTPEDKVKDKIKNIIKEAGGYYAMPVMGGMGNNGTPDFLCHVGGVFIGVEAKSLANGRAKAKPTALQAVRLREIRDKGGLAVVIHEETLHELRFVASLCNEAADAAALQQIRDRIPPETTEPFEKEDTDAG